MASAEGAPGEQAPAEEPGPRAAAEAAPPPAPVRKRQFARSGEYAEWDYLKGAGAWAPQTKVVEKPRFKPGWKNKKSEDAIAPYQERLEATARAEARSAKVADRRRGVIEERGRANCFNPVNGEVYSKADKTWGEATDAWGHLPIGKRGGYQLGPPPDVKAAREKSFDHRQNLRHDRIAKDGLFVTKKPVSVSHILKPWG